MKRFIIIFLVIIVIFYLCLISDNDNFINIALVLCPGIEIGLIVNKIRNFNKQSSKNINYKNSYVKEKNNDSEKIVDTERAD